MRLTLAKAVDEVGTVVGRDESCVKNSSAGGAEPDARSSTETRRVRKIGYLALAGRQTVLPC